MLRDIDIDSISDGKRYTLNDLVKLPAHECVGCSECCHFVEDTILLDPLDIHNLRLATGLSFEELMNKQIELQVVDGLVTPNLKVDANKGGCIFLSQEGRCSIHDHRPGFCRLFPLGRIYEDEGFKYFLQVHECGYKDMSKQKIKKWLGISNAKEYEDYILLWHNFTKRIISQYLTDTSEEVAKKISMLCLNCFFIKSYDENGDFYTELKERIENFPN